MAFTPLCLGGLIATALMQAFLINGVHSNKISYTIVDGKVNFSLPSLCEPNGYVKTENKTSSLPQLSVHVTQDKIFLPLDEICTRAGFNVTTPLVEGNDTNKDKAGIATQATATKAGPTPQSTSSPTGAPQGTPPPKPTTASGVGTSEKIINSENSNPVSMSLLIHIVAIEAAIILAIIIRFAYNRNKTK